MAAEFFAWIVVAMFFIATLFVVILLISKNIYLKNLFPIGYWDLNSMLKDTSLNTLILFGQNIAFLMLFPLAGSTKDIKKPSLISYGFISALVVLGYLRSLLIMGGDMVNRYVYAFHTPVFEIYTIKPMIFVTSAMSLIVLIKVMVLIYASITILTELFNINNRKVYKAFILAGTLISGLGGLYGFGSIFKLVYFLRNIFPYYAVVFEVGLPLILFIICVCKQAYRKSVTA